MKKNSNNQLDAVIPAALSHIPNSNQHQTYQFAFRCIHLHCFFTRQSSFGDERRPLLKNKAQIVSLGQKMLAATMLAQQVSLWDLPSRPFLWAWPGGVDWEHHGPSCPSSLSRCEWQGGDHRPDKRGIVSTRTPAPPHPRMTAGLQILLCLTSVLTCMTPSSVSVLVSITGIPSAVKSAKIFWWSQMWEVVIINLWRPSECWPTAASALVWRPESLMKVNTCLQRRQSPRLKVQV